MKAQTLVDASKVYTNMADRVCLIYETWYTNVICPLNMIYCSTWREDGRSCSCLVNVYHVVLGSANYAVSKLWSRLVGEIRAVLHVTLLSLTNRTYGHAHASTSTYTMQAHTHAFSYKHSRKHTRTHTHARMHTVVRKCR